MVGEPETLSTDGPLAARVRQHDYDRLVMLSDGVFAIAITLLALELRPPEHWDGTAAALIHDRWRALFGYVVGFAVVGGFWVAHRGVFARLVRVSGPLTALSLLLLLFVGLVPAAAALVAEHGPNKAMPAYYLLVALIGTTQVALRTLAGAQGLLHPDVMRAAWRLRLAQLLVAPLVFGLMFVLQLLGLGAYAFLAVLPVVALRRQLRRREATPTPTPG